MGKAPFQSPKPLQATLVEFPKGPWRTLSPPAAGSTPLPGERLDSAWAGGVGVPGRRGPKPLPGTKLPSPSPPPSALRWLAGGIVQHLTAPSAPPAPASLTVTSIWTAVMPALKHTQFTPLSSGKSPGQEPGNPAWSPHFASTSLATLAFFSLGSERYTTFLPSWTRTSGELRAGGGRVFIYSAFSIY